MIDHTAPLAERRAAMATHAIGAGALEVDALDDVMRLYLTDAERADAWRDYAKTCELIHEESVLSLFADDVE